MQIISGGNMLNFGYWDNKTRNPLEAQYTLSNIIGEFASLDKARTLIDVGSGYSAPAIQWGSQYNLLKIICLNINLQQLKIAIAIKPYSKMTDQISTLASSNILQKSNLFHINATSTMLPFKNNSVDRIIAFESAQHFKPLSKFIQESNRVLKNSGLLVIAIPVIKNISHFVSLPLFIKLGLLSLTWASEHYKLEYVKSMINARGFQIEDIKHIGSNVYEPLANYYIDNRERLKSGIIKEYPKFLEAIIYKSLLEMKASSNDGIIDYILLRAKK
jgi:cyclopropane fatty-acyl-phospholipid synthase-like methyltransferase